MVFLFDGYLMARESRDPANDDSLTGTFKEVLRKFLQRTDDMLPAMVQQYDRARNLARVQPLIQVIDTEGQRFNRAPLANVPVLLLGGGSFFMSFNLPAGSLGWIKANDRDISLFLQGFANNRPNTRRLHTFEDGIFIPDIMTGYTIAAEDQQAAVIQSTNGAVKISLTNDRINISAPTINLNTPGDLNITATGAMAITSATLTHNGTNIGATHVHQQGPDSANNIQQDTRTPQ